MSPITATMTKTKLRVYLYFVKAAILLFGMRGVAAAQDFTASTLGDFGNVTVMEVAGNYDAETPEGLMNDEPRQLIAREFYKTHKDVYDFLFIFTNFQYQMPQNEAIAFYTAVKNDVQGIGMPLFDGSSLYGSDGRLQGTIDMGNVSDPASQLRNPNQVLLTVAHELLHRWGVSVRFQEQGGTVSSALLGQDGSHWSYLFDSGASVLYGHDWQDNGDGTFTAIAGETAYSPLDLYLMGFYDKSQVPPMLLIENPDINPDKTPEVGVTIEGTARYVTIDDIIAVEGDRLPGAADSQKSFRTAFIFAIHPGSLMGDGLYHMEKIRNALVTRFSILTDGQGLLEVASATKEDLPRNPGTAPPVGTPRTTAGDLNDGVSWLMANQRLDGSWSDSAQTTDRETTEALRALKEFSVAQNHYTLGLNWAGSGTARNTDYRSRRILALTGGQREVGQAVSALIQGQNRDGGWGTNTDYGSDPTDTAFALQALLAGGYEDQAVLAEAVTYLQAHQNDDGGWGMGNGASNILTTVHVLSALNELRNSHPLEEPIARGLAWLVQKQNPDGGFGNSPSTVYDTALALLVLKELNVVSEVVVRGVNYILERQWEDGSWEESAYQTALAVRAISRVVVEPDLAVFPSDMAFIPGTVSAIPTNIAITADIRNLGKTDVPQAKVVLYDGSVAEENKLAEQILAFPGEAVTTVTFSVTVPDGSEHRYYVAVDPDGMVAESNEANNTAYKALLFEPTYDFDIGETGVVVSQSAVDAFEDVTISAQVSNQGTMNAYDVQVTYSVQTTEGLLLIGTNTVDIAAGETTEDQMVWRTNRAGENMQIVVSVDPGDSVAETAESNKQAGTVITVHPATEPNLTIAFEDISITPSPALQGGATQITALVKNEGFSPASDVAVQFYQGDPAAGGALLGEQIISSLGLGESAAVSIDWTNIEDVGERIIYVQVDPAN
ncbi:MAG: CARDB domain-containing protein, partial [bacterium]|nr:CARDB domain-containing protein [bacterium]